MSLTHTEDRLEVIHENPVEISEDGAPAAEHGPTISTTNPSPEQVGAAGAQSTARPTFTITDAAAACSVSRKTITRKLSDLSDHGAAKDDDGVWRIPVEALLAVGLVQRWLRVRLRGFDGFACGCGSPIERGAQPRPCTP